MSDISHLCQHRWDDILRSFGVDEVVLNGRNQPCPMCGGKDRFRYTNYQGNGGMICNQCMPPETATDGFAFLMQFTGKDFKNLANDIRQILGETLARPAQNSDVARNRERLQKIWSESLPLSKGCPTHLYLLNRGLAGIEFGKLTGLRCHPALAYWHVEDGKPMSLGSHPAMIGLVTTPDGAPSTIHCTYLTHDGRKGAFDPARKVMPPSRPMNGGAVRLQKLEEGQVLCVAEGIETALSMKLHYPDCCPWAVISSGNMQKFEPPNDTSNAIYIAADNDGNYTGQAAAYALAKKLSLKKIEASVLMPDQQGDFLDQLNRKNIAA